MCGGGYVPALAFLFIAGLRPKCLPNSVAFEFFAVVILIFLELARGIAPKETGLTAGRSHRPTSDGSAAARVLAGILVAGKKQCFPAPTLSTSVSLRNSGV